MTDFALLGGRFTNDSGPKGRLSFDPSGKPEIKPGRSPRQKCREVWEPGVLGFDSVLESEKWTGQECWSLVLSAAPPSIFQSPAAISGAQLCLYGSVNAWFGAMACDCDCPAVSSRSLWT